MDVASVISLRPFANILKRHVLIKITNTNNTQLSKADRENPCFVGSMHKGSRVRHGSDSWPVDGGERCAWRMCCSLVLVSARTTHLWCDLVLFQSIRSGLLELLGLIGSLNTALCCWCYIGCTVGIIHTSEKRTLKKQSQKWRLYNFV